MTADPRAALAEAYQKQRQWPDHPSIAASHIADDLAERGVLLVTEADLLRALRSRYQTRQYAERIAATLFAALSGEATA